MKNHGQKIGLFALLGALVLSMAGCNHHDACATGSAAAHNIQELRQSLIASKKNPAYFHQTLCPWIAKSENPYLRALGAHALKLSKKLNPGLPIVGGESWHRKASAMFSAQGIGEQLSALSDSLAQACADKKDGVSGYFFEEAMGIVNFAIPQYYASLNEYGGCHEPGLSVEPSIAEQTSSKSLLPDGTAPAGVGSVETGHRDQQQIAL